MDGGGGVRHRSWDFGVITGAAEGGQEDAQGQRSGGADGG
jgi:hypothetical protein